ncbi:SDR family oxidoreductase [Mesorhizobium sp. DCY119]|uniref:SDR family NAD(P)-dependent oxidoreductase n=1 Tax=Mesorhizobium sp. DCY119 TaxID=2108445 RepID=UPI000E74B6AB|nr:SDR family oxidoreductase [Mesorhizobium sp. DCY119]RJG40859.1 SDR family oxidoreductase [Mesorhizobium sp. DCY119]
MTERFSLKGRVAVVTGSSRGLGFEMAKALGESGARVWMTARGQEQLEASAESLRAEELDVRTRAFDLADGQACMDAIREIGAAEGRLDILVNNAGINAWEPLAEATTATWDRVMGTNVRAPYLLCREAARLMVPNGWGRIINVGSALAVTGREKVTAYVASKHGLAGMTRALAAELGPKGVTCNMMAPGYFLTEINTTILARPGYEKGVSSRIPLGRWGDPEEAGGVIAFMASKASSYINGHVLVVDGGMTETFVLPVDAA